jgi:very-short-patch-repair endonuclease
MIDDKIPFEKSFASHEKAKYWSDKNEINPNQVYKKSGKKYLFKCENCNHEFETSLDNITILDRWCPYCCVPSKKLCSNQDCVFCFEKSFASHEKSKYWSDKNKDNPRSILKFSNKKYIFDCNCGHQNYISLNNLNAGNWCSYCCNPPQKLCEKEDCVSCYERSFASHNKCKYWSKTNVDKNNKFISARQVFKKCDTIKYKLYCDVCNHEFERALYNVKEDTTHCIYCVIPTKILCDEQNCNFCNERSFASHNKSEFWSNKNKYKPREVVRGSNNKFVFNCNKLHEFSATLSHIVNGTWCPICVNKTEEILYEKIKIEYPNIISQYKTDWCKNNNTKKYLRYDFVLHEYKIIIELDGEQHFTQVSNWKSPEEQFDNDKFKQECANNNGYSIIRILQVDVFNDKYDWKTELIHNIEKIKTDSIIKNVYMCKNNEYEKFIN